jgi:SnoaL-like domain
MLKLARFDTPLKASLPELRRRDQVMQISHAGTDVHAVLDEFAAAHAAHDTDGLFALYSDDIVSYSLAPPLQQGRHTAYGTRDGIRAWFAGFDGPVQTPTTTRSYTKTATSRSRTPSPR